MKKPKKQIDNKNIFQIYSVYNTQFKTHKTIAITEIKKFSAEAESLTGQKIKKKSKKHLLLYIN